MDLDQPGHEEENPLVGERCVGQKLGDWCGRGLLGEQGSGRLFRHVSPGVGHAPEGDQLDLSLQTGCFACVLDGELQPFIDAELKRRRADREKNKA